jgi:hypothetical protein
MVRHHATRIELTNLTDFRALSATPAGDHVVLTLMFTGHDLGAPSDRVWRSTYMVRILAICSA